MVWRKTSAEFFCAECIDRARQRGLCFLDKREQIRDHRLNAKPAQGFLVLSV